MAALRQSLKIGMMPADGVGKEVLPAAQRVLEALGSAIPKTEFIPLAVGWEEFNKNGKALPDETVRVLKEECNAAMFGSVQSPSHKVPGYSSPIVALRKHLDLYANIRPVASVSGTPGRPVDLVIVRENTECLYVKQEELKVLPDGSKIAFATRQISQFATERIARAAYELAERRAAERAAAGITDRQAKVTISHKSNVLSVTDGLFRETAREVAAQFPNVKTEEQLIDSMVYKLVVDASPFDVVVAPNLYGDILSDGAAGLVGSLGLVPSINVAPNFVMGEPVHGSAPDIAGKGIANPIASIRSAALMLSHMGYIEPAARINKAVDEVIREGQISTPDLGGKSTTNEVTEAILKKL